MSSDFSIRDSSSTRRSAARLVAEAEAWVAGRGYGRIRVRSNVKRNRARRFYERAGFVVTKSQRNFGKRLEGSRPEG